jgi:hypothetical protein
MLPILPAVKILKLKDIYQSNTDLLPQIATWYNDLDHFSAPASREIARHLYEYLKRDGLNN